MAKVTVKTEVLQNMVSKISKVVGKTSAEISQKVNVKSEYGTLILQATDTNNYIKVMTDDLENFEDFNITIDADTFIKLVQKTTKATISLVSNGENLTVEGNGKYVLPLTYDDYGNVFEFTSPLDEILELDSNSPAIKLSDVNAVLKICRPALTPFNDNTVGLAYLDFFMSDNVVSTDSRVASEYKVKMLSTPHLVSPISLELVSLSNVDKIYVSELEDGAVIFDGGNYLVYARNKENIDDFDIDTINGFLNMDGSSECTVNKAELVNALERLSLFLNQFTQRSLNVVFKKDCVFITTDDGVNSETVKAHNQVGEEFSCALDVASLLVQLKAYSNEEVTIKYGNDTAILLVGDNSNQVFSLSA